MNSRGEARSAENAETRVDSEAVQVERGMVLLLREPERNGMPERYRVWTVTSVRRTTKGASVKLLGYSPGVIMDATATFPEGLVAGNWQEFTFSQADLAYVYARRASGASKPSAAAGTGDSR